MYFIRLVKRLHRDRRRLAAACVFLFAAGVIEALDTSSTLPAGLLEISVGLALTVLGGGFLVVAGLAIPSLRHMYAPFGVTLFGAALLGHLLPGSVFSLEAVTEGGVRTLIGLGITAVLVHLTFYVRWSDSVLTARRARISARATSALENEALWYGLVPTPGRREALQDPEVLSVDWVDRDRSRVRVIRWCPPEPRREEHIQIEELIPGAYVLYSFVRERRSGGRLEKGLRAVKVIDLGDKRAVYVTEYRHNRSLRQMMFDWIDDALGRKLDDEIAHLEDAASKARAKGAARRDQLSVGGVLRPRAPRGRTGGRDGAQALAKLGRSPAFAVNE